MKLLLLAMLGMIMLMGCGDANNPQVNETYTLRAEDDNPFGASAFYRLLKQQYPYELESYNLPFARWYKDDYASDNELPTGITYCIISPRIMVWEDDASVMKLFVENGNTLVIASDYFSAELQAAFGFKHTDENEMSPTRFPFEEHKPGNTFMKVGDGDSVLFRNYSYFYTSMHNTLVPLHNEQKDTIGLNEILEPDVLQFKWGRGKVIVVTNTRSLSNYFLLSGNNISFAQWLISYFPYDINRMVWDKFYASNPYRNPPNKSIFEAFLKNEALRWAFWITLSGALLWLILSLRRKQRIQEEQSPNINDSIAFSDTIANLYYNRHDNKNIALKMVNHFVDAIRQRYFIPGPILDNNFATTIAAKTGADITITESLYQQIRSVQESYTISDQQLMQLHFTIRNILK